MEDDGLQAEVLRVRLPHDNKRGEEAQTESAVPGAPEGSLYNWRASDQNDRIRRFSLILDEIIEFAILNRNQTLKSLKDPSKLEKGELSLASFV